MEKIETWCETWENLFYLQGLSYYHILPEIIQRFHLQVGVEIGVAFGLHAERILHNTNIKTLYCVDHYENWPPSPQSERTQYMELEFERAQHRLNAFGSRAVLIRLKSVEAAKLFQNHQLDFVFIDAAHDYISVTEDLNVWYDKVKPGGVVSGDDYVESFPGVIQACNEFFSKKGIPIKQHPDSPRFWWMQKPIEG